MPEPAHLRPTATLAPRVIVPGDPGRALRLAQALLEGPRMFNHHRGLWGYSGIALDGEPLTIQSTGMGGPSAAIVLKELLDLGAEWLLRVGTCGGLDPELPLGRLITAGEALAADGTSRALGAGERTAGDARLVGRLAAEAPAAMVVSSDLFYEQRPDIEQRWRTAGATAVEMETATLYALAAARGVPAASLLIVSDRLGPAADRLGDEQLHAAEERAGRLALRALGSGG